jgi:hypothetical protein
MEYKKNTYDLKILFLKILKLAFFSLYFI